jgi:hypothetical protein
MRVFHSLLGAALAVTMVFAPIHPAFAQPVPDGEGPSLGPPVPPSPEEDPAVVQQRDVDEFVAQALYDRGTYLYARANYVDAKQLFVEALMRAPTGPRARDALGMLRNVNEKLGIKDLDDGAPGHGGVVIDPVDPYGDGGGEEPVDPYGDGGEDPIDPYGEGTDVEEPPPPPQGGEESPIDAGEIRRARQVAAVIGAYDGALIGMALTGIVDVVENEDGSLDQTRNSAGVIGFAAGGLVGLGGGWLLTRKRDFSMGQARAVASASVWGSVAVALLADAVTGADSTDGNEIVRGAAIGTIAGTGVGILYARKVKPSVDDVAVINSFAAYGTVGGLLVGMAMDPPESEAYSLNAVIGMGAGVGIGAYLADKHDISRRRMLYIDLGAAAGAAVPLLLLAAVNDDTKTDDNQAFGFLSALGLVGGAVLAKRWTRNMDADKTPLVSKDPLVPGLAQRASDGTWSFGGPALAPANNPALGPTLGRGVGLSLLGGSF